MPNRSLPPGSKFTLLQITAVVVFALLLGNVSAMIDAVLHPEIPYFDKEHLIVGGITAIVSFTLSLLLILNLRKLESAKERIDHLEAVLPICAYCKRIRKHDTDPRKTDSWQPLESYFVEHTSTHLSHGICPECFSTQFPDHLRHPSHKQLSDS